MNRHKSIGSSLRWLGALALVLAAAGYSQAQSVWPERVKWQEPGGEDLYLSVNVNGNAAKLVAHVVKTAKGWWMQADAARAAGLPVGDKTGPVCISCLAGVGIIYNVQAQDLTVTLGDVSKLATTKLRGARPARLHTQTGRGMVFDYDVTATSSNGRVQALGLVGVRAFSSYGTLISTARFASGAGGVRLGTTFAHDMDGTDTTWRVGDFGSGSLPWSRAVRMGGFQIQRNFALDPNLITFPLPDFYGQAVLPSTLDVYLDGLHQESRQVPAGPFNLAIPAMGNGAGAARVLITDALGRQQAVMFPYYTSNILLAPGLTDYSFEGGFLRKNYGLKSFDYSGTPVISGSWKQGVSNSLTWTAHTEVAHGFVLAGVGANVAIGRAGVGNFAVAASSGTGSGWLLDAGYSWHGNATSFSVDHQQASRGYMDVADFIQGQPMVRQQDRISAALDLRNKGSFSIGYLAQILPDNPPSRYVTFGWSHGIGKVASINVGLNYDLENNSGSSVFASFFTSLGGHRNGSIEVTRQDSAWQTQANIEKPADPTGGFGWLVSAGNNNGGRLEGTWVMPSLRLTTGLWSNAGGNFGYAEAAGSMVLMDGRVFAARAIDGAFALVSSNGVPGVPVTLENRLQGNTNSGGWLLVTPLNSNQLNRIALETLGLSADLDLTQPVQQVVPASGVGVTVNFPLRHVSSVIIEVVDSLGTPLPAGTTVSWKGHPDMVTGYGGEIYLENPGVHEVLVAHAASGECEIDYHGNASRGISRDSTPITCKEIQR